MNEIRSQEDDPPDKDCLTTSTLEPTNVIPEWKKLLKHSFSSLDDIAVRFGLDINELRQVYEQYPARVNSYYLSLIKEKGDPIYLQAIPQNIELEDIFGEEDPLHEEPENQARHEVPSLVTHRYPDRALFRISNECAMYCRFCTRKRKVGDTDQQPNISELEQALGYISDHEEIRDVILSGGDPLMLSDHKLESIIKDLYGIIHPRKHGIIRIGTRIPCVLPQRVTPELAEMLGKYHPLYINTHFNHPAEITKESHEACNLLANAGIPLGNQTVLLKGVNDDPETMKELLLGLLDIRVKPYYIYQCDPVKGTTHFRTRVETSLQLYDSLRGHISGMAVPNFVIDAPGGGGKVRIYPSDLISINDNEAIVRNYEGRTFSYPQPPQEN